jgi:hypothetical protein
MLLTVVDIGMESSYRTLCFTSRIIIWQMLVQIIVLGDSWVFRLLDARDLHVFCVDTATFIVI